MQGMPLPKQAADELGRQLARGGEAEIATSSGRGNCYNYLKKLTTDLLLL